MWHHTQYINWGDWGDCHSGTNWVSIGGWWAVALCIIYIFQSFYYCCCHFISVIITIISFFFSVLLNRSYLNPRVLLLFPIFFPIPLGGGEWVSGCVVLSCWLGLNQDTDWDMSPVTNVQRNQHLERHTDLLDDCTGLYLICCYLTVLQRCHNSGESTSTSSLWAFPRLWAKPHTSPLQPLLSCFTKKQHALMPATLQVRLFYLHLLSFSVFSLKYIRGESCLIFSQHLYIHKLCEGIRCQNLWT